MARPNDVQRVLKLVQELNIELVRHHREMADRAHVGSTDLLALGLLAVRGPMAVNELGRALELSSASVTELVRRIEASGHAVRAVDAADRRRVVVQTTPLARETMQIALLPTIAAIRHALAGHDAEQLTSAAEVLEAVLGALRRLEPS